MKSRAARVSVRGSLGERLASSIAKSSSPASFAVANHLPSSPGVLWMRSRRNFRRRRKQAVSRLAARKYPTGFRYAAPPKPMKYSRNV